MPELLLLGVCVMVVDETPEDVMWEISTLITVFLGRLRSKILGSVVSHTVSLAPNPFNGTAQFAECVGI